MSHNRHVRYAIICLFAAPAGCDIDGEPGLPTEAAPHDVIEATIPELQAAMSEGRLTSRDLVQHYLTRIAIYENLLNATITVNPD